MTELRPNELRLADLQPGAFVLLGPNEANEKKGIQGSSRIWKVVACDPNVAILQDTGLIPGSGDTIVLFWKGFVRFYDAERLVNSLQIERSQPPLRSENAPGSSQRLTFGKWR